MHETLAEDLPESGSSFLNRPKFAKSSLPNIYKPSAAKHFQATRLSQASQDCTTAEVQSENQPSVWPPRLIAHQVYDILRQLFAEQGFYIRDNLDYQALLDIQKTDWQRCREREKLRATINSAVKRGITPSVLVEPNRCVFGQNLDNVLVHAAVLTDIGGYKHDVPIIVYTCVQELFRRGIHQPDMFRINPELNRMAMLQSVFDEGPNFGRGLTLHPESTHIVCGLITFFIRCLPNSIVPSCFLRPLWLCSVKPTDELEAARRIKEQQDAEEERNRLRSMGKTALNLKPHQYDRKYHEDFADDPEEEDQIKIAQVILRCIPQGNLSLLIYMCNFFSRLSKVPENGVTLDILAENFGTSFCGSSGGLGWMHSEKTFVWIVTRWHRILPGLLPDVAITRQKLQIDLDDYSETSSVVDAEDPCNP